MPCCCCTFRATNSCTADSVSSLHIHTVEKCPHPVSPNYELTLKLQPAHTELRDDTELAIEQITDAYSMVTSCDSDRNQRRPIGRRSTVARTFPVILGVLDIRVRAALRPHEVQLSAHIRIRPRSAHDRIYTSHPNCAAAVDSTHACTEIGGERQPRPNRVLIRLNNRASDTRQAFSTPGVAGGSSRTWGWTGCTGLTLGGGGGRFFLFFRLRAFAFAAAHRLTDTGNKIVGAMRVRVREGGYRASSDFSWPVQAGVHTVHNRDGIEQRPPRSL